MMMSEYIQKYRFLKQQLPDSSKSKIVLLTGARQTGKTTLAKQTYPDLKYINLDAPENRELIREISTTNWYRDIGNAVIDEAQKEPIVFDKIKYAFDDGGISFEVILGSSQILLLKKIRESLAGRVSIYELWSLMMSELYYDTHSAAIQPPVFDLLFSEQTFRQIFNDIPGIIIDKERSAKKDVENHLLKWGGMPALLPLSDDERIKWLKDYEYTYLERDLGDLARLNDLQPFRKLQKLAALRSGQLLNYSELARDAAISVDTARRYLEYLAISYQVILLQPFYKNLTSSTVKTPKLYWLDIGLLRTLSGFWGDISGPLYETMVVGEIVRWVKTMNKNGDIYFYRTRSGLEVDILLQTQSGIVGIEIKSRGKIVASDITALKQVAQRLGDEWKGGLLIYRGEEIKQIGEPKIWAVPSWRLFV